MTTNSPHALPSVTEILSAVGLFDSTWLDEAGKLRGQAVHLACALDDEGTLDEGSVSDGVRPYLDAYRRFRREYEVQWAGVEERLTHPLLRYSGRPDRWGLSRRSLPLVLDVKTGGQVPAVRWQLAGYEELIRAAGYTAQTTMKRCALELRDNGRYSLTEYKDASDRTVFLGALQVVHARLAHGLYALRVRDDEERKENEAIHA